MAKKEKLTPMMQQFEDFKRKYPNAVLLFRCGDFYETYNDDAVLASQVLGITLTRRSNKGSACQTAMAGFPYHALDTYLPKLVRAGHRVAICDQLEDPKKTKKLVKRGVTELVTPGVVLGDSALNSRENNFLASIFFGKASIGLSLLDISTGEFCVAEGTHEVIDKLLASFAPKEMIVERAQRQRLESVFHPSAYVCDLEDWAYETDQARQRLCKHFHTKNLKGFGVDHLDAGLTAAGAVLVYLEMTQHLHVEHINCLKRIEEEHFVRLDTFTIRNLELVQPMHNDGQALLQMLDHTLTPMGARLLHRWTLFPLRSVGKIEERQDGVENFFRSNELTEMCDEELTHIGDLERTVSKIAVKRVSPRELQQCRCALESVARLKQVCEGEWAEAVRLIGQKLDACEELLLKIKKTLVSEPPAITAKGGMVAMGVDNELDELRSIRTNSKEYLAQLRDREAANTNIPSLKIGFNNVFGYYIEVRNTYKANVPSEWVRKQTLTQAERYITQELKEYEEKILGAEERIFAIEQRIYDALVEEAGRYIALLQRNAAQIARLDCFCALARGAKQYHYVRPVVDESTQIEIKAGRHPVIERMMPLGEVYVPNDILLDADDQQIVMITGPNMAGKSALLRQTALITLMAQMGAMVPADSARVGLVDKIFTRVGASDNISVGESTFMVEMSEAANIMNNITPRSLVLFDELGRGTSTYDGMSIAWAIVEHLHEVPKARARTLFATHYHELNEMEAQYERVRNWNVAVKEAKGKMVFLRKLMRGGSEHSFGINVAKLAGMPKSIVKRAEEVMHQLEAKDEKKGKMVVKEKLGEREVQMNLFELDDPVLAQIRDEILGTDINQLTPMDALNKLNDIKTIITGRSK